MTAANMKKELYRLTDQYRSVKGVTLPFAPRLYADHYLDLYRAWQYVSDVKQVAWYLGLTQDDEGAAILTELLQEPQDFVDDMERALDLHTECRNLKKKPQIVNTLR